MTKSWRWALVASALTGCGQGVSPDPMGTTPEIKAEVESCRGESIDLSPDGRWLAVTCRDFSAVLVPMDPGRPDGFGAPVKLAGAGSGEGIRFHPSGRFAAVSTYKKEACPQGHAHVSCKPPFGSEVVILSTPEKGPPAVIDRWPLAEGEDTCLGGEDVAFSADGRRLAVICNQPQRLFVYDADPASAGFGKLTKRVDVPTVEGRSGWLDEVAITAEGGTAYITELDDNPKQGRVRVISTDGAVKAHIDTEHMVVGLHLDPGGQYLLGTAWELGAIRIDRGSPSGEKGQLMLRYDGGGFSYDLTTDAAPGGQLAYAVTQYPARLDVYDFDGRKRSSLPLPDVKSRQPTATAPRGDRARVYVQHEVGKIISIDPKVPAPEARLARFGLESPCAQKSALRWSAPGATEVKVNGEKVSGPEGSMPVEATQTSRYEIEAVFPRGTVRSSTVHWRPGAKYYSAICGVTPPKPAPTPTPAPGAEGGGAPAQP